MGYLEATGITKTIQLSQGYSAVVKALRGDDEDAVQAALMGSRKTKASFQGEATNINLEMDNAAQIQETLLRGIESWTIDDASGVVVKVDVPHLAWLTGGDRNLLYVAINNLTTPPDDAEKKGSPNDSTSS